MKIRGLEVTPVEGVTEEQVQTLLDENGLQPVLTRFTSDGFLCVVTWKLSFEDSNRLVVARATQKWRDESIISQLKQIFPDLYLTNA
jgi:hypothetical protein